MYYEAKQEREAAIAADKERTEKMQAALEEAKMVSNILTKRIQTAVISVTPNLNLGARGQNRRRTRQT